MLELDLPEGAAVDSATPVSWVKDETRGVDTLAGLAKRFPHSACVAYLPVSAVKLMHLRFASNTSAKARTAAIRLRLQSMLPTPDAWLAAEHSLADAQAPAPQVVQLLACPSDLARGWREHFDAAGLKLQSLSCRAAQWVWQPGHLVWHATVENEGVALSSEGDAVMVDALDVPLGADAALPAQISLMLAKKTTTRVAVASDIALPLDAWSSATGVPFVASALKVNGLTACANLLQAKPVSAPTEVTSPRVQRPSLAWPLALATSGALALWGMVNLAQSYFELRTARSAFAASYPEGLSDYRAKLRLQSPALADDSASQLLARASTALVPHAGALQSLRYEAGALQLRLVAAAPVEASLVAHLERRGLSVERVRQGDMLTLRVSQS